MVYIVKQVNLFDPEPHSPAQPDTPEGDKLNVYLIIDNYHYMAIMRNIFRVVGGNNASKSSRSDAWRKCLGG